MTQEEKTLLLQDLCSRLPYGVICHYNCVTSYDMMIISKANAEGELKGIIPLSDGHIGFMVDCDKIDALEGDIKPYLRPMSSMTEEELDELLDCEDIDFDGKSELVKRAMLAFAEGDKLLSNALFSMQYAKTVDWLNAHHFDFRNLIERGLAIDCTDLNVY